MYGVNADARRAAGIHSEDLNAVHHSVICHKAAGFDDTELFEAHMRAWLGQRVEAREARNASAILHAAGKLKSPPSKAALVELVAEAMRLAPRMNAQSLANSLWGMASLGLFELPALQTFVLGMKEAPSAGKEALKPQEVANAIWALASLGYKSPPHSIAHYTPNLGRILVERALPLIPAFNAQDVSNILWALPLLGVTDGPTLATLLSTAARLAPSMTPQNITMTLKAAGDMKVRDKALVLPLFRAAVALSRTLTFNPQDVSLCLWAAGACAVGSSGGSGSGGGNGGGSSSSGEEERNLVLHFARLAVQAGQALCPQNLSNTLHALATLGVYDVPILRSLVALAGSMAPTFTSTISISTLMWSLGKVEEEAGAGGGGGAGGRSHSHSSTTTTTTLVTPPIVDAVLATAAHLAHNFTHTDASMALLGAAKLGLWVGRPEVGAILAACIREGDRMEAQGAGVALWSAASLGVTDREVLGAAVAVQGLGLGPWHSPVSGGLVGHPPPPLRPPPLPPSLPPSPMPSSTPCPAAPPSSPWRVPPWC
jgi:uncharacterized membrane protein YgcG